MTDNEIIKALEEWIKNYDGSYVNFKTLGNALDLINRQKAEIERLCAEIDELIIAKDLLFDEAETLIKKAKSEARKEFAEKAKEIIDLIVDLMFDDSISKCQLPHCHKPSSIPCENETCIQENKEYWHGKLDNLLKEMESEKDA